jgi:hypothetical protein
MIVSFAMRPAPCCEVLCNFFVAAPNFTMEDPRRAIETAGCEMLSKHEHHDFAAIVEPIYGEVRANMAMSHRRSPRPAERNGGKTIWFALSTKARCERFRTPAAGDLERLA